MLCYILTQGFYPILQINKKSYTRVLRNNISCKQTFYASIHLFTWEFPVSYLIHAINTLEKSLIKYDCVQAYFKHSSIKLFFFLVVKKKVFSIIETTHFSWYKKLINIAFENSLCKKTAFKFIDLNKINYMKIGIANWRDFSLDLGGKLVSGVF